ELQRTKDEGWRELNNRAAELDHLREVISEQERILEERRVGLIALETQSKELRAENERYLRDAITIKNDRDEASEKLERAKHNIEALHEEHRRLVRVMNEGAGGTTE